jgi:hypothetical protein
MISGKGPNEDQQFFVGAELPTCTSKNRYGRRARISGRKFRQLVRFFALDFSAIDIAQMTPWRARSVTMFFLKIRKLIVAEYERATPLSGGEVEVNEGY